MLSPNIHVDLTKELCSVSLMHRQAPAWNTIAQAFSNNSKVVFGDVNLAEDQVQGQYAGEPGAGGWPTIRTYNAETGYEGKFAGDWKDANSLEGAMCDVFGKEETMQARRCHSPHFRTAPTHFTAHLSWSHLISAYLTWPRA